MPTGRPGRLGLAEPVESSRLEALRTVVAVHLVESFPVARPRALLGHQALGRVLAAVGAVLERRPGAFGTMRLSAAGADSPELRRLRDEIAGQFRVEPVRERAQLLVALRRAEGGDGGWELLVRTTPRPLSARPWRVCDLGGALDATLAAAMARLAGPSPEERYLNLACGSATLIVERLALGPAAAAVGVDRDAGALECARRNLGAAGQLAATALLRGDAGALPLASGSFDTAVADLPFGQLSGSAESNRSLYAAVLAEAARALAGGGVFVAITAHTAALEDALALNAGRWRLERRLRVSVPFARGYLRPSICVLRLRR